MPSRVFLDDGQNRVKGLVSGDDLVVDLFTNEIVGGTPRALLQLLVNIRDPVLLEDFFLTYRSFLSPMEVLTSMFDSLCNSFFSEQSLLQRVRTFVALRYWIYQHFADDFVGSLELRENFTGSLSKLSTEKAWTGSQRQILLALRRCWLDCCYLYWEPVDYFFDSMVMNRPLSPGGNPGSSESFKPLRSSEEADESLHVRLSDFTKPPSIFPSSILRGEASASSLNWQKRLHRQNFFSLIRRAFSARRHGPKGVGNITLPAKESTRADLLGPGLHKQLDRGSCSTSLERESELQHHVNTDGYSVTVGYYTEECADSTISCQQEDIETINSVEMEDVETEKINGEEDFGTGITMSPARRSSPILNPEIVPKVEHVFNARLKRRPGGNLRAAQNVQDLERTQTSASSSFSSHELSSMPSPKFDFDLSALGITIADGIIKLAHLEDDPDDTGGFDVALQKLEGKYLRKRGALTEPTWTSADEDTRKHHRKGQVLASPLTHEVVVSGELVTESHLGSTERLVVDLDIPAPSAFEGPGIKRKSLLRLSRHMPFVLGVSAKIIAEQLTILEKDALCEIDWMELLGFDWCDSAGLGVRDWLEYLRDRQPRGINVVIARFNLTTSWVASEIVMTRSISERALVVEKFVRIAAAARSLRNFSTCIQITTALQSPPIARLHATWARVMRTVGKIWTSLCQSTSADGDWHLLRVEMAKEPNRATIPFIVIYLSDLVYNCRLPDKIPANGRNAPLVNLRKHRTSATIIKRLLSGIQQSELYSLEPVPGLWERCLWISSMEEDDIMRCSFACEM